MYLNLCREHEETHRPFGDGIKTCWFCALALGTFVPPWYLLKSITQTKSANLIRRPHFFGVASQLKAAVNVEDVAPWTGVQGYGWTS